MVSSLYQLELPSRNDQLSESLGIFKIANRWIEHLPKSANLIQLPDDFLSNRIRPRLLSPDTLETLWNHDPEWSRWNNNANVTLENRIAMLLNKMSLVKHLWIDSLREYKEPSSLEQIAGELLASSQDAYQESLAKGFDQDDLLQRLSRKAVRLFALIALKKGKTNPSLRPPAFTKERHAECYNLFSDNMGLHPEFWKDRIRLAFDRESVLSANNVEQKAQRNVALVNSPITNDQAKHYRQIAENVDGHLNQWSKPRWLVNNAPPLPLDFPYKVGVARSKGGRSVQQDKILLDQISTLLNSKTVKCPVFMLMNGHGPNNNCLDLFCRSIMPLLKQKLSARADDSHAAIYQAVAGALLDINEKWDPEDAKDDSGLAVSLGIVFNEHAYFFGIGDVRTMIAFEDGRFAQLLPFHCIRPDEHGDKLTRKVFAYGGRTWLPSGERSYRVQGTLESLNLTGVIGDVSVSGLTSVPFFQMIPLADAAGGRIILSSEGAELLPPGAITAYLRIQEPDVDLSKVAETLMNWAYLAVVRATPINRIPRTKNSTVLIVEMPPAKIERLDKEQL